MVSGDKKGIGITSLDLLEHLRYGKTLSSGKLLRSVKNISAPNKGIGLLFLTFFDNPSNRCYNFT